MSEYILSCCSTADLSKEHFESRDIQRAMEYPDITVEDKHIQINLVIPDFFEES